jgi:hypothetical protein
VIGRWRTWEGGANNERQLGGRGCNERGAQTTRGNQAAKDAMRGWGGQWEVIGWWMTQREERGRLQGPNAGADDMTRGGSDNARHVACNDLLPYTIDLILDNLTA